MYMADMEIHFDGIRGRPLALGATVWVDSLAIAAAGLIRLRRILGLSLPAMRVIALAMAGLGKLLPILRDGGLLASPLGGMLLVPGFLALLFPAPGRAGLAIPARPAVPRTGAAGAVFGGLLAQHHRRHHEHRAEVGAPRTRHRPRAGRRRPVVIAGLSVGRRRAAGVCGGRSPSRGRES